MSLSRHAINQLLAAHGIDVHAWRESERIARAEKRARFRAAVAPYARGAGWGLLVIVVGIATWVRLNLDVNLITNTVQLRQSVDALKDEIHDTREENARARRCPL